MQKKGWFMKRKKLSSDILSGIYSITNKENNKKYIGSSKDIYRRWLEHERELNKNTHHSLHLQNAWNKYGKDVFIFEIIEIVDSDDKYALFEVEQKWMDYYKCYNQEYGYNMTKNSECPIVNPASYDSLIDGKHNITWDQFFRVVYYLLCTEYEIPKISNITGVQYRTVYQIYYHETYKNMTK